MKVRRRRTSRPSLERGSDDPRPECPGVYDRHYVDQQGLCHSCGVLLDSDWWELYAGEGSEPGPPTYTWQDPAPGKERWRDPEEVEPNSSGEGGVDSMTRLAERLVTQTERAPVEPNRAGRLRGSAMKTSFGREVDPDAVRVNAIDAAMDRYEIFHDKTPIRVAELAHEIPTQWVPAGDALAVMYRTDKWKPDGTDEDYKHLHDKGDDKPYPVGRGVKLYEPVASRGRKLPVAQPKAITLLGYCLGAFVRRDDGEVYETNPRGCYLFSSPSGDLLLIYSPQKQADGSSGFLGAMAGGRLRVLKDGIDG